MRGIEFGKDEGEEPGAGAVTARIGVTSLGSHERPDLGGEGDKGAVATVGILEEVFSLIGGGLKLLEEEGGTGLLLGVEIRAKRFGKRKDREGDGLFRVREFLFCRVILQSHDTVQIRLRGGGSREGWGRNNVEEHLLGRNGPEAGLISRGERRPCPWCQSQKEQLEEKGSAD